MRNKIQKYLSGEREGFSLVELIIVIAIMAILIGIVALAVIPYLEKSRVGKDKQTIDTVYSAFKNEIASQQSNGKAMGDVTVTIDTTSGGATTDDFDVKKLAEALDCGTTEAGLKSLAEKLSSAKVKDNKTITCTYTKSDGKIEVTCADPEIKSSNKE